MNGCIDVPLQQCARKFLFNPMMSRFIQFANKNEQKSMHVHVHSHFFGLYKYIFWVFGTFITWCSPSL